MKIPKRLVLFPCAAHGRGLWSRTPASNFSEIIKTAYPVGNGKLAALPFGDVGCERLSLNRDSLWSGGPFSDKSYSGGNPDVPFYKALPGIRDEIWRTGSGNVTALEGSNENYGSYAVLGNATFEIAGVGHDVQSYNRSLDLMTGVHTSSFISDDTGFTTETYCSYPDDVCVYSISSTQPLPVVRVSLENVQLNAIEVSSTCDEDKASSRLKGHIEPGGMKFDAMVRIAESDSLDHYCTGHILVVPSGGHQDLTFVIAAGTDYDQNHGTAEFNYSFQGVDPASYVEETSAKAGRKTAPHLREAHIEDYGTLAERFALELPDTTSSSALVETAELIRRYNVRDERGDPYLEALAFDYGRHLLISSERDGSLPANLQGKWATSLSNAWSADYHANINLQMNHWPAEQTGLGEVQKSLWDYMALTWVPRGGQTARLLYNASGWVVHNEMNIFGHTGMKAGGSQWANYPVAPAWMMQHVWDHYDYTRDAPWLRETGYPLLRSVAACWLTQLQKDKYSGDGSLVAVPCNSAEHGPTTFGCAHWQQLIHQVLDTTLQATVVVREEDEVFVHDLRSSLAALDKGLHVGSWGQVQEWKFDDGSSSAPGSTDVEGNTHRHLSQLVGWYPGWSLSAFLDGYNNQTIRDAVATTLRSRGDGWRGACWARLDNAAKVHYQLRLAIAENWAPNALSMYSGHNEPFQIDANFGFVGAVLSMLVVDLPLSFTAGSEAGADLLVRMRTVVLGPAIPAAWGGGSVRGLRVRGGGVVDFGWDGEGLVKWAVLSEQREAVRVVNRAGQVLVEYGG